MEKKYEAYYERLRYKIKKWLKSKPNMDEKWSDYILLAPDLFYLLASLVTDSRVPNGKKLKLAGAIAYFISPIDLIPEALTGPIGFIDDIALAALVINDLINNIDPIVVRDHWKGERDILDLVKSVLHNADSMLGGGIWKKITKRFSRL